jgi:hypothetical protein
VLSTLVLTEFVPNRCSELTVPSQAPSLTPTHSVAAGRSSVSQVDVATLDSAGLPS